MTPGRRGRAGVALGAAAAAAALSLPLVLAGWALSPDAVEHVQIAHSWLHGSGFVSALLRAFNLEGPPVPAAAVRPPVFPALVAIPLGLGATLAQLAVIHVLWASAIAGAIAWVGCRFMRPPAALGAALVVGCSPLWITAAILPLTEAASVAATLLVVVAARRATTSTAGALLCAAASVLAWLTHPRLGALALAVFVALVWEGGLRAGWRSRLPWIYGLACLAAQLAAQALARATTGLGIYSGYATASLGTADVRHYGKEYVGLGDFVLEHAGRILAAMGSHASLVADHLLWRPSALHLGWLIPFGVLWALARRPGAGVEQRILALCAVGFVLATVANWIAFEPRYLTLPFLCGAFCVFGLLDEIGSRLEARTPLARWLPLAVAVVGVGTVVVPDQGPRSLRASTLYRTSGTLEPSSPVSAFCGRMDRDAIVATPRPFEVVLFCGNASMVLPTDLDDARVRERFLTERHPGYLLSPARSVRGWQGREPRLRLLHHGGGLALWEVVDAPPASRPWRAPPPVFCAGRPDDCVAAARD